MVASKCFCYVRTDPDVPKHKGISVLIIDLDTPGVEVRPLRHLGGRAEFAEVFFTDVVGARPNLVGDAERRVAHHDGLAGPRARRRCGSRGSWAPSGASTTSSAWPAPRGRRHRPGGAPPHRRAGRAGPVAAGARVQGLRLVRPGLVRARAQLHEAGHLRAAPGDLRARHGPAGRRRGRCSIPTRGRGGRRAGRSRG